MQHTCTQHAHKGLNNWFCLSDNIIICYESKTRSVIILVLINTARSKEGSGSISDGHEIKKEKSSKKSKKEIKSPVELQPPLGPLVALGKPRDRLKRPRYIYVAMCTKVCSHSWWPHN